MYDSRKCKVPNCGNRRSVDAGLIFHRFPKCSNLRNQWIQNCNITTSVSSKSFVCSAHFSANDYLPTRQRKKTLKKTAVPHIVVPVIEIEIVPASVSCIQSKPSKFVPRIHSRKNKNQSSLQDISTQNVPANDTSEELSTSDEISNDVECYQHVIDVSDRSILDESTSSSEYLHTVSMDHFEQDSDAPTMDNEHDSLCNESSAIQQETIVNNSGVHVTTSKIHTMGSEEIDYKTTANTESMCDEFKTQDSETHLCKDVTSHLHAQSECHCCGEESFSGDGGGTEDEPADGDDSFLSDVQALEELENIKIKDDADDCQDGQDVEPAEEEVIRERANQFQKEFSNGQKITLLSLIRNDEDLIAFTGINIELLDSLTQVVSMCESKASQAKFSNSLRERIVMCLCKLRLNLSFRCLSVLFAISRSRCSMNFAYMIQLLSKILKKCIYWPTHEECADSLPKCFAKFPKTRVVLDCTEVPVEKPRCLQCRLRLYSHYKGCETIKLLIGTTPCGSISYLSEAYGGRASDKGIFNQSGILEKLDPNRDAIMVDKGFDIDLECLQAHIQLIKPPKLGKKLQMSVEDTSLTNEIARARVHVERSIQRMKLWQILKSKVSLCTVPYIDNICTVIAALVNLKNPLLADDKF